MDSLHDLLVIGAGPAGLTAAIYARRSLLDTVVVERESVGGQVLLTSKIDNYPGAPEIDGYSLIEAMRAQAADLGATFVFDAITSILKRSDGLLESVLASGEKLVSKAVVVALGASARRAGFGGEERLTGRGISYCATCDAMFYRNKSVYVVGGGNSAAEEALHLAGIASSVTMLVRKDHLAASPMLAERLASSERIKVLFNTEIDKALGDDLLDGLELRDNLSDRVRTENFEPGTVGVFVAVGRNPQTSLLRGLCKLDALGYACTDDTMATETPGLFAAGDLRAKPLRQIVTAASDGAIAASSAASYIQNRDNISYVK